MPAPKPVPQKSHNSTETWGRLFLGSAAAVVLALSALVLWRFAQVLHPDLPVPSEKTVSQRTIAPSRQVVTAPSDPMPAEEAVPAPAEDIPAIEKQLPRDSELARIDPPPPKPQPLTADQIVEQRLQKGEDELRLELLAVPEVRPVGDFEVQEIRAAEKAARGQVRKRAERESSDYAFNVRLHRNMKQAAFQSGLVLRSELNCRLDSATATIMAELSKDLRDMGFISIPGGQPIRRPRGRAQGTPVEEGPQDQQKAFQTWCDLNKVERLSGTLPTLLQMLQVENVPVRLTLVRELGRIKSTGSTAALASRAIVDLSPEVRAAAVTALQSRLPSLYVPALLRGLRYPWPAVADHAAVALRQLAAEDAVASLVDLLDQPDPSLPVLDPQTGQYVRHELVRLNHLRNCLLCHAPSANKQDGLVRGLVPTPGERLPQLYYAGQTGDFVRADITYLHQDFSVVLPEKDLAKWPAEQRFDFVTRKQPVPDEEVTKAGKTPDIYPQREAVLYALRGLTRKDAGDSSTKWRAMLGFTEKKKPEPEIIAPPVKDIIRRP
jgi:hypothetical protein